MSPKAGGRTRSAHQASVITQCCSGTRPVPSSVVGFRELELDETRRGAGIELDVDDRIALGLLHRSGVEEQRDDLAAPVEERLPGLLGADPVDEDDPDVGHAERRDPQSTWNPGL